MAYGSRALPSGVRLMCLPIRLKRGTPSSVSRSLMCVVTPDWAQFNLEAVLVKLPSWASVKKMVTVLRSWCALPGCICCFFDFSIYREWVQLFKGYGGKWAAVLRGVFRDG